MIVFGILIRNKKMKNNILKQLQKFLLNETDSITVKSALARAKKKFQVK